MKLADRLNQSRLKQLIGALMGRKVVLKKRKKKEKERPFNDEDTEIQIREDFVRVYCLEPLQRKAQDDPVTERVLTNEILDDIDVDDEADTISTRTRERYLPQMPTHIPFLKGIENATDPTLNKDLELCLRQYNDAIRFDKEMAKVFMMGLIRQLRYWIIAQEPKTDIDDDASHLLYIRNDFIPALLSDLSVLENHMTPEIDLEYFRRLPIETMILVSEIDNKLHVIDQAQENLRNQGFDPLNPDAPQALEYPEEEIIDWIINNPDQAQIVVNNPDLKDDFIYKAWKELFAAEGVDEFLNCHDKLATMKNLDGQKREQLSHILDFIGQCTPEELAEELERPENSQIRDDILLLLNISRGTARLELIQALSQAYSTHGIALPESVISEPEQMVRLLISNPQNHMQS